ncbi:hypothetical protein L6452_20606 [Arctium lappa]|uniref:Uncharacterized protein n=1 Tax=Arctium lappa TaxID=4217 RepID=A0ACB9BBE5_ARCLA|nr:hypothetical protein L6452_20606 [Arctium lappa]
MVISLSKENRKRTDSDCYLRCDQGGIAQGLKSSIQILSFFRYAAPGARSEKTKWAVITSLDISNRNLSGTIPQEIKYLTHLHHLNISVNTFVGPLRTTIFDLTFLRTLDVNHNLFNSTFPPGISKMKLLEIEYRSFFLDTMAVAGE